MSACAPCTRARRAAPELRTGSVGAGDHQVGSMGAAAPSIQRIAASDVERGTSVAPGRPVRKLWQGSKRGRVRARTTALEGAGSRNV